MPEPKLFTSLPEGSNFSTGSSVLPAQLLAPHLSATHMLRPSRSISTALVEPHIRPAGSWAQFSTVRYGFGAEFSCANRQVSVAAAARASLMSPPLQELIKSYFLGPVDRLEKASVGHRVHDVVDPYPDAERRIFLFIRGIVRPLPRIAQIGIECHRGNHPMLVVVDGAPGGRAPRAFLRDAGAAIAGAGHLIPVAEVIDGVKNGIAVVDVHGLAVGEDALEALFEHVPALLAPEIVGHEESAALNVIAKLGRLSVGELPGARLHRVQPRPVVNVVAVVQIHRLLYRARMHARQPPQRLHEMPVRSRIILRPHGVAVL